MFFKKKKPVEQPYVIVKTREQWSSEADMAVTEAIRDNKQPPYRIRRNKSGTYCPEKLMITKYCINYWIPGYHRSYDDYINVPTKANVYWKQLAKDNSFLTTIELAEEWLAKYIAEPEITYYNGPPLEKVVDFKA